MEIRLFIFIASLIGLISSTATTQLDFNESIEKNHAIISEIKFLKKDLYKEQLKSDSLFDLNKTYIQIYNDSLAQRDLKIDISKQIIEYWKRRAIKSEKIILEKKYNVHAKGKAKYDDNTLKIPIEFTEDEEFNDTLEYSPDKYKHSIKVK